MQKMRQNVPKTIQIKYPAPYSQSWNAENTENVADVPPISPRLERRKSRMNSMSAQSWLDSEKNAVGKLRPMRTVSSQQTQPTIPNRCSCRRTPSQYGGERRCNRQPPVRRPDPSAPHLKYGLFANPRRPVVYGNLSNTIPSKATLKRKAPSPDMSARIFTRERQRTPKEEEYEGPDQQPMEDPPLLVFRPISHRHTQRLSTSNIRHLDIRPGRRPISPNLPRIIVM